MTFVHTPSILKPRVTEKTTIVAESGVFVFEVKRDATKASVAHDIKKMYGVTPLKIAIINTPAKKVISRGKVGSARVPKKAYVYLKKGDTINLA